MRIVPYAITVMTGTLDRLIVLARKAEKGELAMEEMHAAEKLLEWWVVLNGIRSLLP